MGVSMTFSFYVYAPLHLTQLNTFSQHQAFGINTFALGILILFIPCFGKLSDYINRVTLLKLSSLCLFILALPYFWCISHGSLLQIMFLDAIIAILTACFFSVAPAIIAEAFPVNIRCTSIATVYQIIASLAAGLTPIILLTMSHHANDTHACAYFMMASILVGGFSLFLLKDKN